MATSPVPPRSREATEPGGEPELDARVTWARLAQAKWVLQVVTTELGRAGVDVLAVKGVVTAGWLYEDPTTRPLGDVDIRIRPRDFRATYLACERAGWVIERRVWTYRNLVFLLNGFPVDVDCYVGPAGVIAIPIEEVLERATRDPLGFWIPEAYDHAVLLTVNVFKDKLVQAFSWAMDDVERVVGAPGFDLAVFVERLRHARATAIGWIVADWLVETRQSEGWREVRARLAAHGVPRPRYVRAYREVLKTRGQFSLEMRVLARVASDDPKRWAGPLLRSAAWEVEQRWDARRRSR